MKKTKETASITQESKKIKCREYPVSQNGKTCEYLGYIFMRDGSVCSPRGKFISQIKEDKDTGNHITLIVKDKFEKRKLARVNLARAIYSMFSGEILELRDVITFKNGDSYDCNFDNLQKQCLNSYITELNTNPEHGRKRKFSKEQCDKIKKEYYAFGLNYKETGLKYGCSSVTIQKIIRGTYFNF